MKTKRFKANAKYFKCNHIIFINIVYETGVKWY